MSVSEVVRRRAVVQGRVQGVFFRDSVRRWAQEHGLSGWVRNCDDGSVETVLEGEAGRIDRVLGLVESGPPRSDVKSVAVSEENPAGLEGFQVR